MANAKQTQVQAADHATAVDRIAAMRQALKTMRPEEPKPVIASNGMVADAIGSAVPAVKTFFDAVSTSYKYHEAVRKDLLSA